MDRLALALDPAHARHAARYEAALRERNRLLAGEAEPDPRWLDSIEAQLAEAGAALAQGRAALVERLSAALAGLPEAPFARPALAYAPGGPLEADAARRRAGPPPRPRPRRAAHARPARIATSWRSTMAGTGMPAAQCSTGEQKAMLIAITLAHAELAAAGRPGVLLLDEVAAHLDPLRRAALFERLRARRGAGVADRHRAGAVRGDRRRGGGVAGERGDGGAALDPPGTGGAMRAWWRGRNAGQSTPPSALRAATSPSGRIVVRVRQRPRHIVGRRRTSASIPSAVGWMRSGWISAGLS